MRCGCRRSGASIRPSRMGAIGREGIVLASHLGPIRTRRMGTRSNCVERRDGRLPVERCVLPLLAPPGDYTNYSSARCEISSRLAVSHVVRKSCGDGWERRKKLFGIGSEEWLANGPWWSLVEKPCAYWQIIRGSPSVPAAPKSGDCGYQRRGSNCNINRL